MACEHKNMYREHRKVPNGKGVDEIVIVGAKCGKCGEILRFSKPYASSDSRTDQHNLEVFIFKYNGALNRIKELEEELSRKEESVNHATARA